MMLLRVKAKKILINFIMFSIVLFTVYLASFYSHASNIIGTAKVTADSLNVRSGPGKEYDAMGKLYSGNVVDVKAVEGDWLKIDYNSSDGYISIDYVEYEPDEELVTEEEEEQIKEEGEEEGKRKVAPRPSAGSPETAGRVPDLRAEKRVC